MGRIIILPGMNTTILAVFACTAGVFAAQAAEPARFSLELFADGFVSPTTLVPLGDKDGTVLVADQAGTIDAVSKEGKKSAFGDLRSRMMKVSEGFDERGLLGMALHPKFEENRKIYLVYSAAKRPNAPPDWDHTMRLSEFTVDAEGKNLKNESERVLLQIDQPYFNHNGGMILFGPDGYLYFASGDGGAANDVGKRPPEGNGQNLQTLMGKILRLDVNVSGRAYGIPQDNPFVGKQARPEIWAYGLRNPWRMSFDAGGTRELFAADVGQDAYEEVNIIRKGGNYGWNIREGLHCFDPKNSTQPPEDCAKKGTNGDPLIDPIFEYKNFKAHQKDPQALGISVTGGYVYRGKALPHLEGKYVFGDWSRSWGKPEGVLFVASKGTNDQWTMEEVKPASHPNGLDFYVTGFGEDAEKELYVFSNNSNGLSGRTGKVLKIVSK
jgi:glucose/arabinose dehydrogenase